MNRIFKGWPIVMSAVMAVISVLVAAFMSPYGGLGFFIGHVLVQAVLQFRENAPIYRRKECVFNYCPNARLCRGDACLHPRSTL